MTIQLKAILIIIAAAININAIPAKAAEIAVGDSAAKVFDILGRPEGQIKSGTFLMLSYPRGKIELRDKVVTKVDLISESDLKQKIAEEKKRKTQRAAAVKKQKEQRHARGLQLRSEKLSDPEFTGQPTAEQISYWEEFRKMYPDIDVESTYLALLETREKELREEEINNRLAAMEKRLEDAEARAQAAEQEARQSEYTDYYPYVYYPHRSTYIPGGSLCEKPKPPPPVIRPRPVTSYHKDNHAHAVHPESLYGNSTIRAIRSSKSATIKSFRR